MLIKDWLLSLINNGFYKVLLFGEPFFVILYSIVSNYKTQIMNKIKTFLAAALMGLAGLSSVNAQAVSSGDMFLQAYYGGGLNLGYEILKSSVETSTSLGANISSSRLGPVGGRFAYMVSDKVSLGVDVNYSDMNATATDTYDYTVGQKTLRAMARFDIHFWSSEKFDSYLGIGAGYRSSSYYFESTDHAYVNDALEGTNPVAFRIAYGGQYFFSDALGANLEIGLGGGGLVRAGLSTKF